MGVAMKIENLPRFINEYNNMVKKLDKLTSDRDQYKENLEWLIYWCLRYDDPPISIGRGMELLGLSNMIEMRAWMADYSMNDVTK
jgi:hypothetical protein